MFAKSRFDEFTSNKSMICGMSQISRTYTTLVQHYGEVLQVAM